MTRTTSKFLPFTSGAAIQARHALLLAAALLLAGCGTGKGFYAGASAQVERAAAEAAVAPQPGKLETQATYLRLVEQMQRDGLWFASLAHLDALEQRWGASPPSLRLRADALRQTGQSAESRRQYLRLVDTPLAGAAFHGLGLLAGGDADFEQAVHLLGQAQQRNPTDAVVLSDLGYAHLRAGRLEMARVPLMQAAQLRADSPQVQANLALYLMASRQDEQAEAFMAAHRMAPATRLAIRQAARDLPLSPLAAPSQPSPPLPSSPGGPAVTTISSLTPQGAR